MSCSFGEKFRIIKSTDGLVSDGWVDTYGYDLVSKVIGVDGTELVKEEALVEQDSKNIGVNFSGKLKVTYTMESDFSANGEIVLTILEEASIVYPESVSFMGSFAASNWENDIDLVTADEGATWTGSQDFVVGDTWKLRMNHGWATSWGFDNLRNYPAEALDNEPNADGNGFSGNIRVLQAGTFTVTFDYLASKIDVTFVPGAAEPIVSYDFSTLTSSSTAETAFANDTVSATYSSTNGKVYFNGTGDGGAHPKANGMIKVGTGKVDGDFTLTYADDVKITKVVIVCHDFYKLSDAYPTNSNTISVNGSEPVLLPYNADGAGEEMTFEIAETNVVSFTFHYRAYIWSITLY